ncbi:MAG: hypothetical protein ACJAWL_001496 [Motiliproteus sp.]
MSKRTPTETEAKIVASLEIGRSMPDVARQFRVDLSTVRRVRARYGVTLGSARIELIEEARKEARRALDPDWIRDQAAFLIRDDIAQAHQLREHINQLFTAIPIPGSMSEHALLARSLTAISSALKNSSDMAQKALGLDRSDVEQEGLPMLIISELPASEVAEMRRKQKGDEAETLEAA